ncbi:MAG: SagB/ThcOx family dehydrogenase, partial [Nitrososphaerales archaeon]
SVLTNHEEVKRWVHANGTIKERSGKVSTASRTIKPSSNTSKESPLDKVILKRGSTRRFANKAVSFEQLSNVLLDSSRGVPLDCLSKHGGTMMKSYLIANAVEGLSSGAYYYDRSKNSLLLLKEGEFRKDSGALCLGQPLFSSASIVFFLMTDLEAVLDKYGNRGYRAAQFEAGVTAGKIYLSAYAQGLGASGSTFYDDAVTQFFSPHAEFSNTMIAVGVGVPDYRARPGEVLVGKLSA